MNEGFCMVGFTGPTCAVGINACASAPCQNQGVCQQMAPVGYNCHCLAGYSGTNCEYVQDACASTPCLNKGLCITYSAGYLCQCLPGVSGTK